MTLEFNKKGVNMSYYQTIMNEDKKRFADMFENQVKAKIHALITERKKVIAKTIFSDTNMLQTPQKQQNNK